MKHSEEAGLLTATLPPSTFPPDNQTGSGNTLGGDKRTLQLRDSWGFSPHSHFIATREPQKLWHKDSANRMENKTNNEVFAFSTFGLHYFRPQLMTDL